MTDSEVCFVSVVLGPCSFLLSGCSGVQEEAEAPEDQDVGRRGEDHHGGRLEDGGGAARHHMQPDR